MSCLFSSRLNVETVILLQASSSARARAISVGSAAKYTICMVTLVIGSSAGVIKPGMSSIDCPVDRSCCAPANAATRASRKLGGGTGTRRGSIVSNLAWARMTAWWAANAVPQRENSMFFVNMHPLTVAVKSATPSCPTPPSLNAFFVFSGPACVSCPQTPELEAMASRLALGTSAFTFHVLPLSSDVQMLPPNTTTASFVPSALEVMLLQFCGDPTEVSSTQVAPLSVEVQMLPPNTTTASFVPSALEVMLLQFCGDPTEVSSTQVAPLSVEVQMLPPNTTTASFVPSALEVMLLQFCGDPTEVSSTQVAPLSVEVQISNTTTASFVPSALEAMLLPFCGDPTEVSSTQVAPLLVEVQMLPPDTTAASFVPSALIVMLFQFCGDPTEVSSTQVAPLSVEVQMLPPNTTTASFKSPLNTLSHSTFPNISLVSVLTTTA